MKRRLRLFHWHAAEAEELATALRRQGYRIDCEPMSGTESLKRLVANPPEAILIDLSRLPSRGRDLALWLRKTKATRSVPIVFVGGAQAKVAAIREHLPDAVYATWPRISSALRRALDKPPLDPVVPSSALAGYSGTRLPKKLGIKADFVVALVSAPGDFEETLGELPDRVSLRRSGRGRRDLTLVFLKSQSELERRIASMVKAAEQGPVWMAWPKKSSPLAGDLTQNEIRSAGLSAGLVDYKVCAIDSTWSGLLFARRKKS